MLGCPQKTCLGTRDDVGVPPKTSWALEITLAAPAALLSPMPRAEGPIVFRTGRPCWPGALATAKAVDE
eukprot:4315185-Alexandrium_andersonii.AAC.1